MRRDPEARVCLEVWREGQEGVKGMCRPGKEADPVSLLLSFPVLEIQTSGRAQLPPLLCLYFIYLFILKQGLPTLPRLALNMQPPPPQ